MTENPTEKSGLPDRFQTIKRLGTGATGAVFHAFDSLLQRDVAIKVLHEGSANSTFARFHREAQAASRLKHPHVVSVLDFGIHENSRPYLVMEHLNGIDLQSILKQEGSLTPERACRLLIQLCDALNHANSKGVLHRDIKPSNIIIQKQDGKEHLKIVDFGLARMADHDQVLTAPGATLGTPYYLSPEVISGKEADARSDIYSIGCVLFECLSGYPPFIGENVNATLMMHLNNKVPHLKSKDNQFEIPVGLERIVTKALEKDPKNRFQTTAELKTSLEQEFTQLRKDDSVEETKTLKPTTETFDYGNIFKHGTHTLRKVNSGSVTKKGMYTILACAITCGAMIGGVIMLPGHLAERTITPIDPVKAEDSPKTVFPEIPSKGFPSTTFPRVDPTDFAFAEKAKLALRFKTSKLLRLTIEPETDEAEVILQMQQFKFGSVIMHDRAMTKRLYDAIVNIKSLQSIQLINVKQFSKEMLAGLRKIPYLSTLYLENLDLDDASLQTISVFPNLETLSVCNNPRITGSGLRFLSAHGALVRLYLAQTGVTTRHLTKFLEHPPARLKNINIARLNLNDSDIGSLNLTHLGTIDVAYNPITNETARHLASYPNIAHINFTACRNLDDGCLVDLPKLGLVSIELSKTNVKDLTGLAKNHKLRQIFLDWCPLLSDKAMIELGKMKLEKLSLKGTNITDRGLSSVVSGSLDRELELNVESCPNVTEKAKTKLEALGVDLKRKPKNGNG